MTTNHITSLESPRAITDDLDALMTVMPPEIRAALHALANKGNLLEVVLDLGRLPQARFTDFERALLDREVTDADIAHVVDNIGLFGDDNRAGIERTLHRISAIRNRAGKTVGLTCRVGRAVFGTIDIIRDLVEDGNSLMVLGRPGSGKTTLLREVARVLADDLHKRVVIVDTSNEIAGDGDIPHPGIGSARRMQVRASSEQHRVMIETVENHMPEVIIIDEIGTELEAAAARTIAERGVQLIGTAHGNSLNNLIMNPTLSDLVGGIDAVTLGDEEARRRGTQKTVLERKAPPTFDVLVEIVSREHLTVHRNVAETVDALLRGSQLMPEVRWREGDEIRSTIERSYDPDSRSSLATSLEDMSLALSPELAPTIHDGVADALGLEYKMPPRRERSKSRSQDKGMNWGRDRSRQKRGGLRALPGERIGGVTATYGELLADRPPVIADTKPLRVFSFGVSGKRIEQVAIELNVPVQLTHEPEQADVVLTLRHHYKHLPATLRKAEAHAVPIYVLRSNNTTQVQKLMADIFELEGDPTEAALREASEAVNTVRATGQSRQLTPQNAYIRRLQHQLAERESLPSRSRGQEPNRRVEFLYN